MNEISYSGYETMISQIMEFLNGRVNKLLRCFKYEFVYSDSDVCASESSGAISFYIPYLAYHYKQTEFYDVKSHLILICTHELSHIDQDLNYYKYDRDPYYRQWIEKTNELHSKEWIMSNLSVLHQVFGKFNDSVFFSIFEYAVSGDTGYVISNNSQLVCNVVERYLIDINKARYWEYRNITLRIIHNQKEECFIFVKRNGIVIDANSIFPLIYNLRRFNKVNIYNKNTKNKEDCFITVLTDDEDKHLMDVVSRVNPRFIDGIVR